MKQAVVLGGGGSRGSYQIGVWEALRQLGYQYDFVCGTSVGALNAAIMVQDDFETALKMWCSITSGDVMELPYNEDPEASKSKSYMLRAFIDSFVKEGGFDPSPLEKTIRSVIDEEKIRNSSIDFGLVTVLFPSMKPYILTKQTIPFGKLCDYLMASAACYPAMKGRKIDGKTYVDGGYYSNVPIDLALRNGAERIVAVDLESIGIVRPVKDSSVPVTRIHSRWDLGNFLIFDPESAKRNISLGFNDTMKAFGVYDGEWYTFYKDQRQYTQEKAIMGIRRRLIRIYKDNRKLRSKFLKTFSDSQTVISSHSVYLAWAEYCGRFLDIDPQPVYTFECFNRILRSSLESVSLPEIPEILSSLKDGTLLKNPLHFLEEKYRLAYIYGLCRQAETDDNAANKLIIAAAAFPKEFAAALYMCESYQ